MTVGLVIFDCDGVLVDSEPISNRVFCEMLNDLGIDVTLEYTFEHFVGRSMTQCIKFIKERLGHSLSEDFIPSLRKKTAMALEAEVEPITGVAAAIDALNVPYCVASSGVPEKIRLTLGKTGLLSKFEGNIFSVVEVERPKPAPDVFLHAAAKMGVSPELCIVVEDTPTGVEAGVAAGMRVYGFAAKTPERRLLEAGAHQIFFNMEHLPNLISGQIARPILL